MPSLWLATKTRGLDGYVSGWAPDPISTGNPLNAAQQGSSVLSGIDELSSPFSGLDEEPGARQGASVRHPSTAPALHPASLGGVPYEPSRSHIGELSQRAAHRKR